MNEEAIKALSDGINKELEKQHKESGQPNHFSRASAIENTPEGFVFDEEEFGKSGCVQYWRDPNVKCTTENARRCEADEKENGGVNPFGEPYEAGLGAVITKTGAIQYRIVRRIK